MSGLLTRFRAPPEAEKLGRPWLFILSLCFGVAAVVSGVLGLIGVLRIDAQQHYDLNVFEIFQGVLSLYSGGSPAWLQPSTPLPPSYALARVVAPLSTGYVLAVTLSVLLAERWRQVRARLARGHAVVCATGRSGVLLARSLAREGTTVLVAVDASSRSVLTSLVRRVIPLPGDPRDAVVLRRAGVSRARRLFATASEGDTNASVALAAKRLAHDHHRTLECYAMVEDPELQIMLQARLLTSVAQPSFQLHLIDPNQVFASRVISLDPPSAGAEVVVAGGGPLAVPLTLELVRHRPHVKRVLVSGTEAARVREDAIDRLTDPATQQVEVAVAEDVEDVAAVYVNEVSDQETVRTALSWWGNSAASLRVVVCVDAETGLSGAVAAGPDGLFGDTGGTLHIHSRTTALSDPDHIVSQTVTERLARAMHAEYLQQYGSAAHRDVRSDWTSLAEQYKESNRDQARQVAVKLAALHCGLVPSLPSLPPFAFRDREVEDLAEMEHERWLAERARAGIRFGPERTATTHPDMVAWDDLSDDAREKDRVFVRALPGMLAREGFRVVRLA